MQIELKTPLLARDVRALELELAGLPERLLARASFSHHEMILKAAIGAGWIANPEAKKREVIEDGVHSVEYFLDGQLVDDSDPGVVYRAGHVIESLYQEFTSLDPN